jgi:hypothetical protein
MTLLVAKLKSIAVVERALTRHFRDEESAEPVVDSSGSLPLRGEG